MSIRDATTMASSIYRTFGARGMLARSSFELRRSLGLLRTTPTVSGRLTAPIPPRPLFAFDARKVAGATDVAHAAERARRVLHGEHQAFRVTWLPRPMSPGEWSTNPRTGHRYPTESSWFRVSLIEPAAGDVKDVWEPARFAWAYDLMRGWALTGDDSYPAAFWSSLETFVEGCPRFLGVQWACGQEAAIRATALLWAEAAFDDAPSSTVQRKALLHDVLRWTAERIADAIDYAISQRNNHSISEAVGLFLIGTRLSGSDERAEEWKNRGRAILEREITTQFADDGWYIQHSTSYHRLALDQLVLAAAALHRGGGSFTAAALDRIRSTARLLGRLAALGDGEPPNHGANDGSYVLPLSTRPYRDFSPTLTAAAATFGLPLPAGVIEDREVLAWLQLPSPAVEPLPQLPRVEVGSSGWVVGETEGVRLFARAASYRSRPSHIDTLHVDLWLGDRHLAVDAGSYRYHAAPPWNHGLAREEVHNTVTVAGKPLARRGPRFLWLSWPSASVGRAEIEGDRVSIELCNSSWARWGIRHRRLCILARDGAAIVDDLSFPVGASEEVQVHWLLERDAPSIEMVGSEPLAIRRAIGTTQELEGWISDGYGIKRAGLSVRATVRPARNALRVVSGFGALASREALQPILEESTIEEPDEASVTAGER